MEKFSYATHYNRKLAHLKVKAMVNYLAKICVTVLVIFFAIPPVTAFADQADPDITPVMVKINVYRSLLEAGDRGFLFYINNPYASTPDALVNEAFILRLYDTDNVTELGQATGYAYNSSGYGYNVYFMYFDAAAAVTWGEAYIVRLSGNPSVFDDPPSYDYTVTTGDYTSETTMAGNQGAFADRIIEIANDLYTRWSLTSTTTLILEQETGTVLSQEGENFFRGAIYGVQAMAPLAFQISVGTITAVDRDWDTEYAENISAQYSGNFIATAQNAGASMFGSTAYDLLSILFVLILIGAIIIATMKISDNFYAGLIDAALSAILFARLGIPEQLLPFLGLIAAICWLYISAKAWGVVR